jgi:hypothetical protein
MTGTDSLIILHHHHLASTWQYLARHRRSLHFERTVASTYCTYVVRIVEIWSLCLRLIFEFVRRCFDVRLKDPVLRVPESGRKRNQPNVPYFSYPKLSTLS